MNDIDSLTLPELKKLSATIADEIHKRQRIDRGVLLRRMERLAMASGFTLTDVVGSYAAITVEQKPIVKVKKPQQRRDALPIKYWNPLNPKEGWSGRGRKPRWATNWIENGGELDDLKRKRT